MVFEDICVVMSHRRLLVIVVVFFFTGRQCDGSVTAQDVVPVRSVVCQWDRWNATCPADSVVVVDEAVQGRMRRSKCIVETGYKSDGCSADVRPYMERLCSGRRKCEISLPDQSNLDKAPHGCGELKTYLEISYHCLKVSRGPARALQQCSSDSPARLTTSGTAASTGYLASADTMETGLGSPSCPWSIEAAQGQTITLYLIDFFWADLTHQEARGLPVCRVYAVVREREGGEGGGGGGRPGKTTTVCGGQQSREMKIFTSSTNQVLVNVVIPGGSGGGVGNSTPAFLIKYEVNGCPDFVPSAGMTARPLKKDIWRVGCSSSSDDGWDVSCVRGVWTPVEAGQKTQLPNCTSLVTSWTAVGHTWSELMTRPGGLAIVLVCVTALVIILTISIGIFCVYRRILNNSEHSRLGTSTQSSNDPTLSFDSSGRQYTMLSSGEWKELYPMLTSKHDHETGCGLAGCDIARDYATTLQMRQIAQHHPPSGNATGLFRNTEDPMRFEDDRMHICCPMHHGIPCVNTVNGTDSVPRNSVRPGRFGSFRPRSDHIYEVPRFESDSPNCQYRDDDMQTGQSSTPVFCYHQSQGEQPSRDEGHAVAMGSEGGACNMGARQPDVLFRYRPQNNSEISVGRATVLGPELSSNNLGDINELV